MCISTTWYPLVKLENGKRKILMHFPLQGNVREEMEYLHEYEDELKKAVHLASKHKHFNKVFKTEGVIGFEKLIQIPCGKCQECLKSNARAWAFRILKEAERFDSNWFITLTYDDDHIPHDHMLEKDAISKFNKKLKVYLSRLGLDSTFRFYGVGEYGGQTARPHYHVIYFNLPIPDLHFEYLDENNNLIWSSKLLESVWDNGFVVIGQVDVGSACYVARYCDKKKMLTKKEKEMLKEKGIVPEFSIMSRRPGIGSYFLDQVIDNVVSDCYNINIKGNTFNIPLYYSKKMKELLPPEALEKYESRSRQASYNKIFRDLLEHESLTSFYEASDILSRLGQKPRSL